MQEKTMEVECNGKRLSLQAVSESIETEYGKIMFKLVPEGLVGTTETDMDLFMHGVHKRSKYSNPTAR